MTSASVSPEQNDAQSILRVEASISTDEASPTLKASRTDVPRELGSESNGSGPKIRLADLEPGHWSQVYQLYREVFGERWEREFKTRRQWAHDDNLLPEQTRGWVLLDGGSVVGFLMTIPMVYKVGNVPVVAHTPADYMVHPNYRFHGIKLMKEFFRSCENCVTCDDMRATVRVLEWMGAERAGVLVRYRKMLDARVLRSRDQFTKIPTPLWWPVTMALRVRDIIRSRRRAGKLAVQKVTNFDDRFSRFSEILAESVPVMLVRDSKFFDWRYGDRSPHAGRQIGIVTGENNELAGYVVFHVSEGPNHTGYILDLQTLPTNNKQVATALMNHATSQMRKQGAWTVRYYVLPSQFALPEQMLRELGFVRRGGYHFITKFANEALAAVARTQANWNYSFGDSESSHALE